MIELQKKYIVVKWKWEYEYWLVDTKIAEVYTIDKITKDLKQLWFKSLEKDFFRLFYDEEIKFELIKEEVKEEVRIRTKQDMKKENKPLTPEEMKAKLSWWEKSLF